MDSPLALVILTASVFLAVAFAVQGIYWAARTHEDRKARDLARRLGTLAEDDQPMLFRLQVRDELASRLGGFGEYLENITVQAGRNITLRQLLILMGVCAGGGVLLLVAVTASPLGIVGVVAGLVPVLVQQRKARQRADRLSEQLPGALDLLARSLQAGHGISDSMRMVAEEMMEPIAVEFGRVYEEHNLGWDFRECLQNLIGRNPQSFDIKIFTSSVLLQRETGGNLVEILNNISNTIRQRFLFQGKVRALTAEAKFSGLILGALPLLVASAILVLRPQYLDPLFGVTLGRVLLIYGAVSYLVGIVVMKRIAKIDA